MKSETQAATLELQRVENLRPHPKNVRDRAVADEEMIASVRTQGIHQPLVVAPHPTLEGDYTVIMGHRRLNAAKKAGLDTVPVLVRHDLMDERDQIAAMVQENLHRKDLSIAEEATAVQAMLDFDGWDAKRVARETGLSARRVRARAKLTKLDDATFERVHDGQLTLERAEVLADFAGEPEEESLLAVVDVHPSNWDWHVRRAKESREWRKRRPKVLAELKAAGVEVMDAPETPVWRSDSEWQEVKVEDAAEAAERGARAVVAEDSDDVRYLVPRSKPDAAATAEEVAREARAALRKELDTALAGVRDLEDQWIRDTVLPAAKAGDERTLRVLARYYQQATTNFAGAYGIQARQARILQVTKGAAPNLGAAVAEAVAGMTLVEQAALWVVGMCQTPSLSSYVYEHAYPSPSTLLWLELRAALGWVFVDPEVRAVRELAGEDGPDGRLAQLAGLAPATRPATDGGVDDSAEGGDPA
ncbi:MULTISPECIES: ParB/RepB/Spo0J family partition protein [Streptomyces]